MCPLCTFEAPDMTIILSHLRKVHSNDPHFIVSCGLDGCTTTSRSFSALYSHIYRRHPDIINKRRKAILRTTPESQAETPCNGATGMSQTIHATPIESLNEAGIATVYIGKCWCVVVWRECACVCLLCAYVAFMFKIVSHTRHC